MYILIINCEMFHIIMDFSISLSYKSKCRPSLVKCWTASRNSLVFLSPTKNTTAWWWTKKKSHLVSNTSSRYDAWLTASEVRVPMTVGAVLLSTMVTFLNGGWRICALTDKILTSCHMFPVRMRCDWLNGADTDFLIHFVFFVRRLWLIWMWRCYRTVSISRYQGCMWCRAGRISKKRAEVVF